MNEVIVPIMSSFKFISMATRKIRWNLRNDMDQYKHNPERAPIAAAVLNGVSVLKQASISFVHSMWKKRRQKHLHALGMNKSAFLRIRNT
jgi:hypothetical protein